MGMNFPPLLGEGRVGVFVFGCIFCLKAIHTQTLTPTLSLGKAREPNPDPFVNKMRIRLAGLPMPCI